jgi:drug/metabolite transporter (DMT)-like permease
MGTFMGIVVIAWMLYILVAGRIFDADLSPRRLRALAVVGVLIGVGLIITAWTVNAEPPCGACNGDHWGGAFGVTLLIAFVAFGIVLQVRNVREEHRQRHKARRHE